MNWASGLSNRKRPFTTETLQMSRVEALLDSPCPWLHNYTVYKDGAGASLHILVTAGFHRNYTNRLAEIFSKKPVKSFVTTKELPCKEFVASRHWKGWLPWFNVCLVVSCNLGVNCRTVRGSGSGSVRNIYGSGTLIFRTGIFGSMRI